MPDLSRIRLLALDVDGTLTDGSVLYDDAGHEWKQFHIHDGLGIVLAGFAGLAIAWITGRQSPMVERRARELKVPYVLQGVRDKQTALSELAVRNGFAPVEVAFMGDDLNDLPALRWATVAIAPANAVPYVKELADLVTVHGGGQGAVRDAIEAVLRARGDYDAAVGNYLISLTVSSKNFTQ
jgi:3-deoxy-D-manno-octulosonate 8-phosphate phosphatase (KDO 8-P phosphatase)